MIITSHLASYESGELVRPPQSSLLPSLITILFKHFAENSSWLYNLRQVLCMGQIVYYCAIMWTAANSPTSVGAFHGHWNKRELGISCGGWSQGGRREVGMLVPQLRGNCRERLHLNWRVTSVDICYVLF